MLVEEPQTRFMALILGSSELLSGTVRSTVNRKSPFGQQLPQVKCV